MILVMYRAVPLSRFALITSTPIYHNYHIQIIYAGFLAEPSRDNGLKQTLDKTKKYMRRELNH